MSKLCYPTIELFIYDLKSPLNATEINIADNRNIFQGRFKEKLDNKTKFKEAEQENSNLGYQALLTPNFLKLKTNELKGYFLPVLLHDTYGLLVNCSINNKLESQAIEPSFKRIKQELSHYDKLYKNLTIGTTQILSGWLTTEETNVEKIAKECYQSLSNEPQKWSSNLYGKGKFLNSHIFEIWNPLSNYLDEHLLIIIFSDQETFDKAANLKDKYFQDWIRLFCHRHKIMWTYSQSRTITDALKTYYREVDKITKNIERNSDENNNLAKLKTRLQEIQAILDKFTRNLLELNILKETIEINLDGYVKLTQIIKKKAGTESDLSFLEQFSDLTEIKYLRQIDKDEANMKLGLQLLESNINALRSQIELEKSERDRKFQNSITLIGAATATLTIIDFEGKTCNRIAKSWPFSQKENKENKEPIFPCNEFVFNSIITPVFLIILLFVLALIIKRIIKKVRL